MRGLLISLSGATALYGMVCSASSNIYGVDIDPQTTTAAWPAPSSSDPVSPTATNTTVAKALVAGAGRVDITPAVNRTWLPLNEYEHEKLWVRAIVFQSQGVTSAIIGSDLSNIEEVIYQDTVARVSTLLNTSVENIILSSTHTHGATPCGSALFSTAENYGYYQVSDAAVKAVELALASLEPAWVGYNTGSSNANANRDAISPITGLWTEALNLTAPADREVEVLTFIRPSDKSPIASYTSYAMHPVMSYLTGYTSADWPGAMSRWIENSFDDDMVAIYSQQASGDVNPRWMRTTTNNLLSQRHAAISGYETDHETVEVATRNNSIPLGRADPKYIKQAFDNIEALGIIVGEVVIRVMSETDQWQDAPTIWAKQQNVTCPGRKRLDNSIVNRAGRPGNYTTQGVAPIEIRTGALGIGDIVLVTVGAEIYTKIGWKIKEMTPMNKTMLVTMSNGKAPSGYIPDTESFLTHLTFEVLGSNLVPGSCAEDGISGNITALVNEYLEYNQTTSNHQFVDRIGNIGK
ncbi:hypothetical protein PFICI_10613 [Pestalotiopsis fici W106-1]|uniref:Neutral/alkaline non-lysosomal ceramidase N-terminal domain-containing protein n=1 Tax=Pestalotiopsis fici (strain W106-1 / CGMCC3.15140) TaxID=1229662 RepID=W3X078_PESFW|nr:uncharacterized protein PFICI_10613 [Pestalotiopsis fici W106-1]ETS78551.1 hypothetical protein PFICI_10613 [Pestalotiopsis fici W106-1]